MQQFAAKRALIAGLLDAAAAHEAGYYNKIGAQFEAFERLLAEADGYASNQASLAYNFWDGWIDARNHDWRFTSRSRKRTGRA
jgi:hypothetical protein